MEKYYLYNLYKNLNLYNNFNINSISKNILRGGSLETSLTRSLTGKGSKYYSTVFLELFRNIKNDLEKQHASNESNNEIAIKMRTYYVLLEVYNSYLNQLLIDQQIAKAKIEEADRLSQERNIKEVQKNINNINILFGELLGETSLSGNLPSSPTSPTSPTTNIAPIQTPIQAQVPEAPASAQPLKK